MQLSGTLLESVMRAPSSRFETLVRRSFQLSGELVTGDSPDRWQSSTDSICSTLTFSTWSTSKHHCWHNCLIPDQRGAFWDWESYLITGVHAYSAILKSQRLFVASPLFRKSCNAELRTERTQLFSQGEKKPWKIKQLSKLHSTCPLHCKLESLKYTQTEENITYTDTQHITAHSHMIMQR